MTEPAGPPYGSDEEALGDDAVIPEAPGTFDAPEAPDAPDDHEWQRLDPRMLLVQPLREVIRFLPAVIALLVAGNAMGGIPWELIGIAIPVVLGVLRYVTTGYRVTGGRVELRRGLLSRHVLSTPIDRVRTVDLTASPLLRLLGLTAAVIGTGTSSTRQEDKLDLDGLPVARARELRAQLLRESAQALRPSDAEGDTADEDLRYVAEPAERVVVRLDPTWVRFAPLTSSGVVLAAALLGVAAQSLEVLGDNQLAGLFDRVSGAEAALWLLLPVLGIGLLVWVTVLAVGGYLIANWGFTLSHRGTAWHLSRGLLTTRETSIDDERVAGVSILEPLPLRLARGGRLTAIVTGLNRAAGGALLVPPAPRGVVGGVAGEVLGVDDPSRVALTGHGPAARRRRYLRALDPALLLVAAAVSGMIWLDLGRWALLALLALPVAVALAEDRTRSLGHALSPRHLQARSGSLLRRRDVLEIDHVIGWNFTSTWFQRRGGLTSMTATTAGGRQAVVVLDVPEETAVGVATAATPALLEQFRATG